MKQELHKPKPAWVIPFYHHPVFNAGPLHSPSLHDLRIGWSVRRRMA